MRSSNKPTLHSVAERAQVSIASVSRVINGLSATQSTQERVRQAIEDLGYQPNFSARALRISTSEQICVILPDLSNPVFQSMIRGIQQGFKTSKYRVMLSTSTTSSYELITQIQSLGQNYADGLIINALTYDEEIIGLLKSLRIPVVVLGTSPKGLIADSIRVDNEKGVEMAVEYLFLKKRKKVLLLNGPQHTIPAKLRRTGFIAALKKRNVENPENHVIACSAFTSQAAIEELKSYKNLKKYEAIICANDLLAAGALRFLSDSGISVPGQISIVGIDNTDMADLLNPAVTSVDFKAEYRGRLAATYMKERLADPSLPIRKLLIEPELIERKSA